MSSVEKILEHLKQPGNVLNFSLFECSKAIARSCHITAVSKLLKLGLQLTLKLSVASFYTDAKYMHLNPKITQLITFNFVKKPSLFDITQIV